MCHAVISGVQVQSRAVVGAQHLTHAVTSAELHMCCDVLSQVVKGKTGWCCWQVAFGELVAPSCASRASTSHMVSQQQDFHRVAAPMDYF